MRLFRSYLACSLPTTGPSTLTTCLAVTRSAKEVPREGQASDGEAGPELRPAVRAVRGAVASHGFFGAWNCFGSQ